MKKWLVILATIVVMVACNDEQSSELEQSEKKAITQEQAVKLQATEQQESVKEIDLQQAIIIASHVNNMFLDVWFNAEDLYLSIGGDSFSPSTHIDRIFKRFKRFATENFLTSDYKEYVATSCYACDMVPLPVNIQTQTESHELISVDNESFSIKSYTPLSAYTPEAYVIQDYILDNGIWKLDGEEIEILQEANGNEDSYMETEIPTATAQFEEIYARGLALKDEYNQYFTEEQDGSLADISNEKYETLQKLKSVVEEMEEMIIPFDNYYETAKPCWEEIVKDVVHNVELYTTGGSGQGTAMIEAEAELYIQLIDSLYIMYRDYL